MRSVVFVLVLAWLSGAAVAAGGSSAVAPTSRPSGLQTNLRQLWRTSVAAPRISTGRPSLHDSVRRLRAIQLAPGSPKSAVSSQPSTAPADRAPSARTAPARDRKKELSPKLLERLRELPIEGVNRPVDLADALFLAGHLEEARTFYEHALAESQDPEQKAWLLYQIAACRQTADPAGASAQYQKLLAEYPESMWARLADVQVRLIEWNRINTPRAVLRDVHGNGGQ